MDMKIRDFRPGDEAALSALIRRTLSEVNLRDCPRDETEWLIAHYTPEAVIENARRGHTYVLTEGDTIIGTGTVLPADPGEAEIVAAFLLPEYLGRGCGTVLFDLLETDPIAAGARRIWLTASDTAVGFYDKRGYVNPNGTRVRGGPDHLLYMELRREAPGAQV